MFGFTTKLNPEAIERIFGDTVREEKIELLSYLPGIFDGRLRFFESADLAPKIPGFAMVEPVPPPRRDAPIAEHGATINHIALNLRVYPTADGQRWDAYIGFYSTRYQGRKARRMVERFAEKLHSADPSSAEKE